MSSAQSPLSRAFLDALMPLANSLNAARTLSAGKLGILRHLVEHGRSTATELAAVVQVSPQAISLAARELETLGLVARVPDGDDRRRSWITVTDAGQRTLAEESAAGERLVESAIAEHLTPDEVDTLRACIPLLRTLTSAFSND